ncbi:choice-of-anchor D domain-containing protein [Winogradskyella sp.]|uniref:choice-of-anchor D domain-containing protein n=1 Tax=Winogradskyella sp. TaxID=1883156 RepID=UPI0026348042|nr:choice-of-anchor D domain-containing protein [Winogradskyella sp.]
MKRNYTVFKGLVICLVLLSSVDVYTQTSDFNVQHLQDDIANSNGTSTSFTAVGSLNSALALSNNNRKSNAGPSGNGGTLNGDDVAGARVLTGTNTLSYYREPGSLNSNMRFSTSIWEYIGPEGGANEMIVRGRYEIALNGSTNNVTETLSGVINADKCIPFITGILNSDSSQGADSGTAIAYLEDASTLRVQKGTNGNNVIVYVTVVEFTGSNWTVLHGDSGNVSADTGSITLKNGSDGSGTTTNVSSWNQAIIFAHHRGDNTTNGVNRAIADNWPIMEPGNNNQTVDWRFNSNHDSNGTNRQFVHVLVNANLNVTRYQSNSNSANETAFSITSSGITNINEALIIGSSITSGNGTAYARGWRNYYLKSTSEAAHWSHRSGNTMSHEIQIVDLSGLTSIGYCNSSGHTSWNTGITNVAFNTINHSDGSPKDNGYEDFTATHSTTVYRNSTRNLSVNVDTDGAYSAHAFAWIDWNQDYDFEDEGESYDLGSAFNVSDGITDLSPLAITIPANATLGATRMRIAANFGGDPTLCATNFDGEVEDYEIVVADGAPEAEINITGNGSDIEDGDSTPSLTDHTDFGEIFIGSGSNTRVFTIENLGASSTLNLTGTSPYVEISGTHADDFTLSVVPSNTVEGLSSTTFSVTFNPSAEGVRTASISIANSDTDENPYNFSIQGSGVFQTHCESWGNLDYETSITNVTFNTINHSDGAPKDVGYEDFTASQSTSVETGSVHNLSVNVDTDGNYIVHAFVWIDWNQDFDFEDEGESYDLGSAINVENGITDLSPLAITIPADAQIGATRMRVSAKYWSDPAPCETDFDGEVEDYEVVVTAPPIAEISVTGNGEDIANGDNTPSPTDHTDFGSANTNQTISKIFTINNTGTADLEIANITLSNTTDFNIVGNPYPTTINGSDSATFEVAVNSSTVGIKTSTVTIENNDTDESNFQFTIQASVVESFFDSDGDGVLDNVDIDDDNDGIADAVEELDCKNSNISVTTNYKFLNETFGSGERTTINTTYDAVTSYCFEDGTASCPSLGGDDLNDGEYTVYYRAANGDGVDDTPIEEVGSWADAYWYTGEDHTPGDTNGRMAMFNAAIDPGIFYTANITGALPNIPVTYSFWVLNLDTVDAPGIATRLRPDILVEFRDTNNNLLASITTGDIPPSINGDAAGSWYNFSANLTFSVSEFNVYFYNNQLGGLGNDLAIDDIQITQTLCDTDGDGVANVFDLDSDNDGIPDIVESGYSPISNGTALVDTWVDSNGNGMHDAFEGLTPLDSDGDGTPNYIDLDSDNDTIFDVDESGAGNSGDMDFQNGDGDIDGDGVGDGEDTDMVREKDFNSDGNPEYFGDGILDIYDFFTGATFATAYGNQNQGMTHTNFVRDSDNDGLPDYIDVYNNTTESFDIASTLYADLDANNDGVIDDTMDAEGDGILDLFDTADNQFGSPRDISTKLQIHFDGRNDYVQDSNIIGEWGEITLMGWIKLDADGSGDRFLFGQNNIYVRILSNGYLQANISGTTVNYSTTIPTGRWTHISLSYSASSETYNLYVNGENVRNGSKSGVLNSDTSAFTMSKHPVNSAQYFKGYLDEIRLFNKALSSEEIRKIIYQEIEDNGYIRGTEIPLDIETLSWSDLVKYYRLDSFKGNITDDLTTPAIDENTGATLYNIKDIAYETAPIPFTSQSGDTNLAIALNKPEDGIYGIDAINYDWSIVRISHNNIFYDGSQKHLGLIINENDPNSNPIEYHVTNDSELNVSWYLKLDGFIDLEGESQLLQGENSVLDPNSKGKIERDQQGTADTFTYNYWSSPVGSINATTNNNSYQLNNVLMDGSNAENPIPINWITSGYNGSNASPIGLADYWIWKFDNHPNDDYSSWQHVRSTGNLGAGEGFTMKGPGSGPITADQNYAFVGKPNNGTINLPLNADNNYLVGNPYPSALNADEFINDNPHLSGTLYFWEHWGGGSHVLQQYQGGYAVYSLAGGVPASAPDPDVAQVGVGTKIPGRYIPVSQGFFVTATGTGSITFENDQRIFAKESGSNSVFMRGANVSNSESDDTDTDDRMKFRFGFKSSNALQLSRQILLTIDENTTPDVDWAYDASLNEDQTDDMFWVINNEKYIIQANNVAEASTIYPLGFKASIDGINTVRIDSLENVPDDIDIYIHDIDQDTYHNLRNSDYEVTLNTGEYLNRFAITFVIPESLSTEDVIIEGLRMYYSAHRHKIVVLNPELIELEQIQLFNINGQQVYNNDNIWQETYNEFQLQELSTGVYIINLKTPTGTQTKKIIIK